MGSDPAVVQWHASDNGGFDEVPLGSPPLKPVSADSNGGPPHLEKVAHSLMAYSKADQGPQNINAREATLLRAENTSLKQRLSAIKNVRPSDAIMLALNVAQSGVQLAQREGPTMANVHAGSC